MTAPTPVPETLSAAPPRFTVDDTRSTSNPVPGVVPAITHEYADVALIVSVPFTVSRPGVASPGAIAPPVAVTGPTVPLPPSTPAVRLCGLPALLPLTISAPPPIAVVPVKLVLAPSSTSLPSPSLVRLKLPTIGPATFRMPPPATVTGTW